DLRRCKREYRLVQPGLVAAKRETSAGDQDGGRFGPFVADLLMVGENIGGDPVEVARRRVTASVEEVPLVVVVGIREDSWPKGALFCNLPHRIVDPHVDLA